MNDGNHVAMTRCYFCGGGCSVLFHKQLGDISKLDNMVVSMEPCSTCEGYMKQGIGLITIDDARSDPDWQRPKPVKVRGRYGQDYDQPGIPNPFRTGGFFIISEDAFKRNFTGDDIQAFAMKNRFMFIDHNVAIQMGLFHHGMTKPFREAECAACKHQWLQVVEESESTANISGEKSVSCPLCASKDNMQGPVQQPIVPPAAPT